MKKVTSIFILAVFVLSSTEMHQVLKLPVLIHHYIEHKRNDAGISFIGFLEMHYDKDSKHDLEEHHHEKLPFKSHCCGINHTVIAEVYFFSTTLTCDMVTLKKEPAKYRETFYSSSLLSSIWQPPKAC